MRQSTSLPRFVNQPLTLLFIAVLAACSRAPEQPPKHIVVNGNDEMKFDVTAFEVKPLQKLTLTMKNAGTLPKKGMAHNFVLLNKNTEVQKFIEAGQAENTHEYIAQSQAFHVIAKTKLTGPGESDSVTFTAPSVPGPYDYICTFPGHYASGMKGVMTVRP